MKVVVYAYENIFGGLHGINTGGVFDVGDISESSVIGEELAYDVIDSYSHVFEDYDREEVEEGIAWEVYQVREDTGMTTAQLDKEYARLGFSDFVSEYCY